VAAIRQPIAMADQFGVDRDRGRRPQRRSPRSGRSRPTRSGCTTRPDEIYASMGNYVFRTDALLDALAQDATDEGSKHDMGGNIVPQMVERKDAAVYDFRDNVVAGESERDRGYWRDVGTLDAFYEAHRT
jgi:glucose-1-phosphate adenylyltransferase